jgi:mycothiol synthase
MTAGLESMQLHMFIEGEALANVEVVAPDGGYELRRYRPGDEEGIRRTLAASGFEWTVQRVRDYLAEPERSEGTHVVVWGDRVVAVAFATRQGEAEGRLDFVAADPQHKGHRLGLAVCSAVMRYLADRGYPRVMLTTDDWRAPALVTYLRLGFRPNYCREDMPGRWQAVSERLGWPWEDIRPAEEDAP